MARSRAPRLDAKEPFFKQLPRELSPSEEELVADLQRVAISAQAFLPREVSLQEWAERRAPGRVTFTTNAAGMVSINLVESASEFFDKLPPEAFSDEEDRLRLLLTELLAQGSQSMVSVEADRDVRASCASFLPRSVSLHEWIERRIGGEIQVYDERGETMCRLMCAEDPAASKEAKIEAFFESLPASSFTDPEERLRQSIFDFLASWKSQELASLSHTGMDRGVQRCRAAFLPKEVSLKEWIERRIGGEVELRRDRAGQYIVHLTAAARPIVTAKYEAMEKAANTEKNRNPTPSTPVVVADSQTHAETKSDRMAQFFSSLPEDRLTDEESTLREALLEWLQVWEDKKSGVSPTMSDAGQDKALQSLRNLTMPREVPLREWIDRRVGGEVETSRDEKGQYHMMLRHSQPRVRAPPAVNRDVKEKESWPYPEAFFEKLSQNELTRDELALREALLDWVADVKTNRPDAIALLADAPRERQVSLARTKLLPPEVGLRTWIEKRIGGELEIVKDDKGKVGIRMRESLPAEKKKEAFFESLPADGFAPEEEELREAILNFLTEWRGESTPTLSHAGSDSMVRSCRQALLKGTPVSLKEWIDRRIGGEVEMLMDPTGQWAMGLRGHLDHNAVSKKRKAEKVDDGKGKGKGKDKHGDSAPWKRARSGDDRDRASSGGSAQPKRGVERVRN